MHEAVDNTVLVVEPEPGMRGLLSRWLRDRGYQVTDAGNAPEAFSAMSSVRATVAVCDATVSGPNGLRLAQALHTRYPRTRVVAIAGRRDPRLLRSSIQNGAVDCLFKPLVAERLFEAVERARLSSDAEAPAADAAPPADPECTTPPTPTPHAPRGTSVPERRLATRYDGRALPAARLRSGHELVVLNFSSGGMLAETSLRLLPGSRLDLTLGAEAETRTPVRATVLRCQVSCLESARVRFRAAFCFSDPCAWVPAESPQVS